MKSRLVIRISALAIVILITWVIYNYQSDVHKISRDVLGLGNSNYQAKLSKSLPNIKCNLEKPCPAESFAVRIKSGAANVVGPTICFEGQIVMSHIKNNVGPGMNLVVVNGITGTVDKVGYLNSIDGKQEDMLAYLKGIEQGKIILLASFDDVTPKMTDEIRNVLASMGSTMITTIKRRDNWVFAGRVGAEEKYAFEKVSANDPKTNSYDGWPEVVEISGCFPKNMKHFTK